MRTMNCNVLLPIALVICLSRSCESFQPQSFRPQRPLIAAFLSATSNSVETEAGPRKVAVLGATGRTGQLVVQQLLDRSESNDVQVVAVVRDLKKAKETLPAENSNFFIVKCDLSNPKDIRNAVADSDAAVWCATGFSDNPQASIIDKLTALLKLTLAPKQTSIDLIAIPVLAEIFREKESDDDGGVLLPKVVMLSSAGVTRPKWSAEKKKRFVDCAEIPIVRLNPFGILDLKAESEEKLRESGVEYCIVRPCGLSIDWPTRSRPIFSQGDVAVGRIHRVDVAKILVDALYCTEAVGKTFETFTLKGYAPARSLTNALQRLKLDNDFADDDESYLSDTYALLQQLLPGEVQAPSELAMGQTYEQLDLNQVGRFGKRGEENTGAAALSPSS